MEKIKVQEVVGYLPYDLGIVNGLIRTKITAISLESPFFVFAPTYLGSRKKQMLSISDTKPILRPLSDLTKEIEVNGEKFVPMVELAKIANLDTTEYKLSSSGNAYGIRCNIENDDNSDKWEVLGFDLVNGFGHHYIPSKDWTIVMNQFELYGKLYEWHFDIHNLIERGLAVDINTLNN